MLMQGCLHGPQVDRAGRVIDADQHKGKLHIIEQEFANVEREEEERRKEEAEIRRRVRVKRHEAIERAQQLERLRKIREDRRIRGLSFRRRGKAEAASQVARPRFAAEGRAPGEGGSSSRGRHGWGRGCYCCCWHCCCWGA